MHYILPVTLKIGLFGSVVLYGVYSVISSFQVGSILGDMFSQALLVGISIITCFAMLDRSTPFLRVAVLVCGLVLDVFAFRYIGYYEYSVRTSEASPGPSEADKNRLNNLKARLDDVARRMNVNSDRQEQRRDQGLVVPDSMNEEADKFLKQQEDLSERIYKIESKIESEENVNHAERSFMMMADGISSFLISVSSQQIKSVLDWSRVLVFLLAAVYAAYALGRPLRDHLPNPKKTTPEHPNHNTLLKSLEASNDGGLNTLNDSKELAESVGGHEDDTPSDKASSAPQENQDKIIIPGDRVPEKTQIMLPAMFKMKSENAHLKLETVASYVAKEKGLSKSGLNPKERARWVNKYNKYYDNVSQIKKKEASNK